MQKCQLFRSLFIFIVVGVFVMPLSAQDEEISAADKRKISVLMRLTQINVNEKPKLKSLVIRFLQTVEDHEEYLDYAERFQVAEANERLWRIAEATDNNSLRAKAVELLMKSDASAALGEKLRTFDNPTKIIEAIGLVGSRSALSILEPLVTASGLSGEAKNAAVKGLGKQIVGQKFLLNLVVAGKLPEECQFTAANVLLGSADDSIKKMAATRLKLPAAAGSRALPPLSELVARQGNVARGATVFTKQGTCANCHKVNGSGKEVGPDLTEIGSKLSRQAMYESILNPGLAVSHNYETYLIQTFDGLSFSGILVSETDDRVVIRTAEAVTREISKEDIEGMKKSKKSLMPDDLQKNFSESELIDLVEYLMTLKKK